MNERLVIGDRTAIEMRNASRALERVDEFLEARGIKPENVNCHMGCENTDRCRRSRMNQPEATALFVEGILWRCELEGEACPHCGQPIEDDDEDNVETFYTDHNGSRIAWVEEPRPLSYDAQVEIMNATLVGA